MTKYNTLDVKLSNSALNRSKSGIKNRTEINLNLSSNLIGNSNDESHFSHKLLLPDTQLSKIREAFANGSSSNLKCSKTHLFKTESGGFIYSEYYNKFPSSIIINSVANSFKKELQNAGPKELNSNLLVDAGLNIIGKIIKKEISSIIGSGITLTNNETKDIIKLIKSLDNRGILLKGTTRKITS